MSRTATLWTSAILTLAFVLVVGTMLLRPNLSRSAPAQGQPETTLVGDAGANQINVATQQVSGEHHDDHHDSNEEHEDGD